MADDVVDVRKPIFNVMNYPVEIWKKVFSYLDDEQDLFCCSGVCPLWNSIIDFYGTQMGEESVSRAKILSDRIKLYSEVEHLKTIHLVDRKIEEIVCDCLLRPLIPKLNRLVYEEMHKYDVGDDFFNLPPLLVPNLSLTHLYLDNVLLSKSGFIRMCQTLGHCLRHLFLVIYPDEEIFVDEAGLSQGLALLQRIEHFDAGRLIMKWQENDVTNESNFLQALAQNCPNLRDLSIPETYKLTSANLVQFLKSDNTKHLRFLSVSGCNAVDDEIEEGLQYRLNFFKRSVPKLTILADRTQISAELLTKYSPFVLGKEMLGSSSEEGESAGSILIDCRGTPPFGPIEEYPFMRSTIQDWPESEDEIDNEMSSISGGITHWFDDDDDIEDFDIGSENDYDCEDYFDDEDDINPEDFYAY